MTTAIVCCHWFSPGCKHLAVFLEDWKVSVSVSHWTDVCIYIATNYRWLWEKCIVNAAENSTELQFSVQLSWFRFSRCIESPTNVVKNLWLLLIFSWIDSDWLRIVVELSLVSAVHQALQRICSFFAILRYINVLNNNNNKWIGDYTKAATRQCPNCIKKTK